MGRQAGAGRSWQVGWCDGRERAAVPSGSSRSVRHFKDDRAFDMSEVGPTDKTTRRALTGRVRIGHNVRLPDSPSRSRGPAGRGTGREREVQHPARTHMLRIDRIVMREIRLALKEPFRISSGVEHERRILLLEVSDRDGAAVWAECVAGALPNYSPETIDTAWLAVREWLAPRVLGADIERPEAVDALLGANVRGHHMAKAALEMGCWALDATIAKMSLAQRLGGTRDRVATGISLGLQSTPEALVERAQAAVVAGYRKIKLKIQPGRDLDYVRAVRGALGGDVDLMVDANSAYTLADAEHLAALDELGLIMLEQPLGADDLIRHAE